MTGGVSLLALIAFVPASWLVFRLARPAPAALAVFLGGWLLLPVGLYPPGAAGALFPYWITGAAVPSDMLVTKAWVAPAVAVLGLILFDRRRVAALRPSWLDLPMALWCAWPLLASLITSESRPTGWIASLYVFGTWGLSWLLGRLVVASHDEQMLLVRSLAWAGLACLPISLIEGTAGPMLHDFVYEPHPFRLDGIERYVGFRPIGFFENGNQFGLWLALCALAALWLAAVAVRGDSRRRRLDVAVAVIVVAMALAAQSIGAILLLAIGVALLFVFRAVRPRRVAVASLAALVITGAVYSSGALPLTRIAKETSVGRDIVERIRSTGRGSFTWRIAQDQRLLATATAEPFAGSGTWDWWRSHETRPWGLMLLIVGQFGLIGLALCLTAWLGPVARTLWQAARGSPWRAEALPVLLATIVALAVLDTALNAFVFFPAVLLAGALAMPGIRPRRA